MNTLDLCPGDPIVITKGSYKSQYGIIYRTLLPGYYLVKLSTGTTIDCCSLEISSNN